MHTQWSFLQGLLWVCLPTAAVLISFLGMSDCDEVLEVSPVSRVILKSTLFAEVVTPFSEAEGPTVLGSPAVEVTS